MSLIAPPTVFPVGSPRLQSLFHRTQDRRSVCVGVSVWCSSGVQPGRMSSGRTDVFCCKVTERRVPVLGVTPQMLQLLCPVQQQYRRVTVR